MNSSKEFGKTLKIKYCSPKAGYGEEKAKVTKNDKSGSSSGSKGDSAAAATGSKILPDLPFISTGYEKGFSLFVIEPNHKMRCVIEQQVPDGGILEAKFVVSPKLSKPTKNEAVDGSSSNERESIITPLVALVAGGENPAFPTNSIIFFDISQKNNKQIGQMFFPAKVLSVSFICDGAFMFVVYETMIEVYYNPHNAHKFFESQKKNSEKQQNKTLKNSLFPIVQQNRPEVQFIRKPLFRFMKFPSFSPVFDVSYMESRNRVVLAFPTAIGHVRLIKFLGSQFQPRNEDDGGADEEEIKKMDNLQKMNIVDALTSFDYDPIDSAEKRTLQILVEIGKSEINELGLSHDGKLLATVSSSGKRVALYATRTGNFKHDWYRSSTPAKIYSISFSPDTFYLVLFSSQKTIHIFSRHSDDIKNCTTYLTRRVTSLCKIENEMISHSYSCGDFDWNFDDLQSGKFLKNRIGKKKQEICVNLIEGNGKFRIFRIDVTKPSQPAIEASISGGYGSIHANVKQNEEIGEAEDDDEVQVPEKVENENSSDDE